MKYGRSLTDLANELERQLSTKRPDGHFKFPHLWPIKLPQAGRVGLWVFAPLGVDHDARGRGLP